MTGFEKFKDQLPSKRKYLYSLLMSKKNVMIKNMDMFLIKVGEKFEMKTIKYYRDLADMFEKLRNSSLKSYWIISGSLCECTSFKLGSNTSQKLSLNLFQM